MPFFPVDRGTLLLGQYTENLIHPGTMTTSNNLQKLRKYLEGRTGKAIMEYNMIEDGDTVLVCLSGGKL